MIKKVKNKVNQRTVDCVCKLYQDESGLAGWEILLGILVGVVLVGILLKAAEPTITELWELLTDKFKSLLTI